MVFLCTSAECVKKDRKATNLIQLANGIVPKVLKILNDYVLFFSSPQKTEFIIFMTQRFYCKAYAFLLLLP